MPLSTLHRALLSRLPAAPVRADWLFALRTTSAGLIALLLAFALHLQQPQWAMMTVFIVSQPVAGMVLAKGAFRLLGTLVGAGAGVALTALAGSVPWAFVSALALWIALCTYVATLLRNPESYGAVLAGYTALIIGLPSFGQGHLVVDLAMARCTEIMLGIVCAGLAARFVKPQLARASLMERLEGCIADLARYASGVLARRDAGQLRLRHRTLAADIQSLSAMRAYVRIEAPGLITHGRHMRHTIGHLLAGLSAIRALLVHAAPGEGVAMPFVGRVRTQLDALAAALPGAQDLRPWLKRLDDLAAEARLLQGQALAGEADRVGTAARLSLLAEFLAALRTALEGLRALTLRVPGAAGERAAPTLLIRRDRQAALVNAVRAGAATAIVSAYWMATRWADAEGVAIIVAVVSSLFATLPNPIQSAWGFFRGTLYAVPAAFLIGQVAMPALPGFAWFALLVTPILIPAALAMANPARTGVATAFAINMLVLVNPREGAVVAAPLAFLNVSVAILGGILLGILVFATVLPQRPRAIVARLMQEMREDLARLCLHERIPRASAYESLAYDRINQLMEPARRLGPSGEGVLDASLSAVMLGLEVLRLRRLLLAGALTGTAALEATQALARTARLIVLRPRDAAPGRDTVQALRGASARIAGEEAGGAGLQAAAALRVVAAVIEDHPRFFMRGDE